MTDRYGNSLYDVSRCVRYSRRYELRQIKEKARRTASLPRTLAALTRSEIIALAQRELDLLRSRPRTCLPPHSWSERLEILGTIAAFRKAALAALPPPKGPNVRWYATARSGRCHAYLAGPFLTQREALTALPRARSIAVNQFADTAFASYGTATVTGTRFPTGRLNAEFGLPTSEITLAVGAVA
jgi:hypothetical protein